MTPDQEGSIAKITRYVSNARIAMETERHSRNILEREGFLKIADGWLHLAAQCEQNSS